MTGLGLDENFVRTDGAGSSFFLPDSTDSTIGLTDANGNVSTQYTYDPFGNTTQTGASTSTFQFTGRANDGTGLYYLRARYYSPVLQRFISQDPIGFKGGINLYAYAAGNPICLIDPMGTDPAGGSGWSNAAPLLMLGLLAVPVIGEIADGMILVGEAASAGTEIAETAEALSSESQLWNPLNGPGPSGEDLASTFRSSTYTETTLGSDTTMYRAIGPTGNPAGSWWTTTEPAGPVQTIIDSALNPAWGNTATTVVTANVPAGTTVYSGYAAAQGGLVGGGIQVYIPGFSAAWLIP